MIMGVLALLGAIFSVTSGAADIGNYYHEHPIGQLVGDDLKTACKLNFPNSYDPDTNTWRDMQGHLKKCVCNKQGKCGSHWG